MRRVFTKTEGWLNLPQRPCMHWALMNYVSIIFALMRVVIISSGRNDRTLQTSVYVCLQRSLVYLEPSKSFYFKTFKTLGLLSKIFLYLLLLWGVHNCIVQALLILLLFILWPSILTLLMLSEFHSCKPASRRFFCVYFT